MVSQGHGNPRNRPRGYGKTPWMRASSTSWPTSTASGTEVPLCGVRGYSSNLDVYWNPSGQTIPASTYELRVYARVQNGRCLIGKFTLTSAQAVQSFQAGCIGWDLCLGLIANIGSPPSFQPPPMVTIFAHGRES